MKIKKLLALILAVLTLITVYGCNKGESKTLVGNYTLESAMLNGRSVKKDFQAYRAEFKADGTVRVTVGYLGSISTRNSTYTYSGTTVTEKYNGESFTYKVDGDLLTTTMEDFGDVINITLKKEVEESEVNKAVDFEGVLFVDDPDTCKIFNYCPAIITETDESGNEVMHIWFCTNKDDGVIKDHIGYRKGVKQADGKWLFSELQIALKPTDDTWDARHTCDPAVIKGEFKWDGVTYNYLMAYLGCVTEDYSNNETGIAVAQTPEGPWKKVDHLNPIEPWSAECEPGTWGTGMPALISIDQKGEVLMFYQSSKRGTGIERWDLSNLDAPDLKAKFTVSLTHNGIRNSAGMNCRINIPDFAYDPVTKRFYTCSVTNEKNPADVTKTLVNSHSMVAYVENVQSMEHLCEILQSGVYEWKMLGYVGPATTGWNRNHNPGLVRNAYGYIPDSSKIGVVVSTGHNDRANENIFTYRLHGAFIDVK